MGREGGREGSHLFVKGERPYAKCELVQELSIAMAPLCGGEGREGGREGGRKEFRRRKEDMGLTGGRSGGREGRREGGREGGKEGGRVPVV